ncbi:MAG: regulatory protein GemA [Candidatus Methylumidiphilus sp.]
MATQKIQGERDEQARLVKLAHVGRGDLVKQGKFPKPKQGGKAAWQMLCQAATESSLGAGDGKSSTADMSVDQLQKVMRILRDKGFKPRHVGANGKLGRAIATGAEASKLRAIWLEMAQLGIVRDPSESALCSWASNNRSPSVTASLEMMEGLNLWQAIERLKKMRTREMLKGQLFCPECGQVVPDKLFAPFLRKYGEVGCPSHGTLVPFQWRKASASPAQP